MIVFTEIEKKKIEDIRKNWSLIILIPTLLGGLDQLLNLLFISPSLIKFFSITQALNDGLCILVLFVLQLIPYYIGYKSRSDTFKKVMWIIFVIFLILRTFIFDKYIRAHLFTDEPWLYAVDHCLLFLIIGITVGAMGTKIENQKLIRLMIIGIVASGFTWFTFYSRENNIDNFEFLKNKEYLKDSKVLYFNDKYVFFRTINKKIHIEKLDTIFSE